jgi:opacity protein-like surface antigen
MRRSAALVFSILLAAGAASAHAQVVAAATTRQFSITAGGIASIFQTDYAGDRQPPTFQFPVAHASPYPLFGAGAYVDVKFRRWVQLEAEGRWLRFNQYGGISQDNYLIGPRVPVLHFWRSSVYAKALGGYAKMNFDSIGNKGTFTDIAFGGGMDVKLTKRISIRAADFEYQYYPKWSNSSLSPYGASVGIGYKLF